MCWSGLWCGLWWFAVVCGIKCHPMKPFGEIGANFSLQLSSRTQLLKLVIKKLSPKIYVKN